MTALYVTSLGPSAGKSTLCAGLSRSLLAEGKRVGFFKPFVILDKPGEGHVDRDAKLMKEMLELTESIDFLCPLTLSPQALEAALAEKGDGLVEKVKAAYAEVSRGKEVMLLEGANAAMSGSVAQATAKIAEALDAKVILLACYGSDLSVDQIIAAAQGFKKQLFGVVLNTVPRSKMALVEASIATSLKAKGIRLLGVLPEERALLAISVGELKEYLRGDLLNSPERCEELVENLMVGTMCVDNDLGNTGNALDYFQRKRSKAVITRGDRPDIQMAALETSPHCLILTGNIRPMPFILYRAEEMGTPIIVVEGDTPSILENLEGAFSEASFHKEKKLARLDKLLSQHFDFEALHGEISK